MEILLIIPLILIFLVAVIFLRAAAFGRVPPAVETVEGMSVDAQTVAEHLGKALRFQTISKTVGGELPLREFQGLHRLLEKTYPRVHAALRQEVVNEGSLLYTWAGSNAELDPILLAAHLDVVPVDPATADQWEHSPFGGEIADGYVWGRGAMDCKHQVIGILEAVENLLKAGYQPERTIYLAFGQDEEVMGTNGAGKIAALLEDRGVHLEALLDEGGGVTENMLPGVKLPVATIGTAEKGYLSLQLSVACPPGHSATPPRQTAISILSNALTRLSARPMPARLTYILPTLRWIGAALNFSTQLALANLWLFGGIVKRRLTASPQTDAILRTTIAPTMISGGVKDNLLPAEARATVNFRILPGESIAGVCQHVRRVIDDERVTLQAVEGSAREPSPLSPITSRAYQSLVSTIQRIFGNIPVAPMLVAGGTDAYRYTGICENALRFAPVIATKDILSRIHGVNERMAVADLEKQVKFYGLLIPTWAGGMLEDEK
jgi:carboxypeptidase PM20D1